MYVCVCVGGGGGGGGGVCVGGGGGRGVIRVASYTAPHTAKALISLICILSLGIYSFTSRIVFLLP